MELSVRPYVNASIAATLAGAIALSPIVVTDHRVPTPVVPRVTISQMHLAAAISPADVAALVANVQAAMGATADTVTSVVDAAGNTLTGTLHTAAGLSDTVWDGLIAAAAGSPTLKAVLVALKSAAVGGLGQLATSVSSAGGAITVSTGQVTEILTSAMTGTLGTALQAITNVVNDPLSASSYIGLLASPLGIAGLVLQQGVTGVAELAGTGLALANDLVDGVGAQISNALTAVNGLLDAGKSLTDIALVNGTLTALQGIVSAPVTALLAGATGLSSAIANAGVTTLNRLAGGTNAVIGTWLGSGSTPGAIEAALASIGSAPLSPASYTQAVSIIVGAASTTVKSVVGTASSFASLPFRVGADLTDTAADVVNSLAAGLATAASGVLQAAGVSPLVAGLPHALAAAFTTAVNVASFATKTTLNTIAAAIDFGQALGGAATALAAPSAARITSTLASQASDTQGDRTGRRLTISQKDTPDRTPTSSDTLGETSTPTVTELETSTATELQSTATQLGVADNVDGVVDAPEQPTKHTAPSESTDAPGESSAAPVSEAKKAPDTKVAPSATKTESAATAQKSAATTAAATAATYGRHAAPADRDGTAASSATTTSTDSSGSAGGRHRRADDSTNKPGEHDTTPRHSASSTNSNPKAAAA